MTTAGALLHADIPYIAHYTTVVDDLLVFRSAADIREESRNKPVLYGKNAVGDVIYYLPGAYVAQARIALPVVKWIAEEQDKDWEEGNPVRSVEELLESPPRWLLSMHDEIVSTNETMREISTAKTRAEAFRGRREAMMRYYSDLLIHNVPAERALIEVAASAYAAPKSVMKYLQASRENYYSNINYNRHAKERYRILKDHEEAPPGSAQYALRVLKSMPEYSYIQGAVASANAQARAKGIHAEFTIEDLFTENITLPTLCPIMNIPLTYKRKGREWELPEEYREVLPLFIKRDRAKLIKNADGVGGMDRDSYGIVNGVGERRQRGHGFFGNSATVWRLDASQGLVPGNVAVMSLAGAHKVELDEDYRRAKEKLESVVRKGELYG